MKAQNISFANISFPNILLIAMQLFFDVAAIFDEVNKSFDENTCNILNLTKK